MATSKNTPASETPESSAALEAPASQPEQAPAGVNYQYTWGDATCYPTIPLTAHPARPAVPAVEAEAGSFASPAVPARAATVFAFPDGPPDSRWTPTDLPVNQAPDNAAPLSAQGE